MQQKVATQRWASSNTMDYIPHIKTLIKPLFVYTNEICNGCGSNGHVKS